MEQTIELTLTLREADYLSELLGKSNYGYGSDVRDSFVEKLENERLKALKQIMGEQEATDA